MHALYQNLRLQPLAVIRHEFLSARFAWDIYPLLRGFLQRMVTRRLKLPSGVEDVSGIHCKAYCEKQGYGRSSPTRSTSVRLENKVQKGKHEEMKEECGEGPYDMDSAVSGMSPSTRYWTTIIESGTGKEVGFANNESEQDYFGSRRRKRQ
jgi:hypothetical protein